MLNIDLLCGCYSSLNLLRQLHRLQVLNIISVLVDAVEVVSEDEEDEHAHSTDNNYNEPYDPGLLLMGLVFGFRVVILQQVPSEQPRKRHSEVRWRRRQRQEGALAARRREVEGEHVYHRGVEGLGEGYDYDEKHKVNDIHAEEHGNRPSRLNASSEQYQIVRIVVVLQGLHAEKEDDNKQRRHRHINSKRRILSIVLCDDLGQHEEQQCEDQLRTDNDKTKQEESPEFVVADQILEDLNAGKLVDFLCGVKNKG